MGWEKITPDQVDSWEQTIDDARANGRAARQTMIDELQKAEAAEEASYRAEKRELAELRQKCERFASRVAGKPPEDPEGPLLLEVPAIDAPTPGEFSNWAGGMKVETP